MVYSRTHNFSLGRGWDHVRWVLHRASTVVRNEGMSACFRRIQSKVSRTLRGETDLFPFRSKDLNAQYRRWRLQHTVTPATLDAMGKEASSWEYCPTISLVMPIVASDSARVEQAIRSVCGQVYPHWRLCLVCQNRLPQSVEQVVSKYIGQDKRIVQSDVPNIGVGSSGRERLFPCEPVTFVGWMGDSDELAPEALFSMAKRLNAGSDVDLLYSDHDSLTADGTYCDPFFKPGWNPDLLLSMNYLAPLCLFRESLLSEIEGAQSLSAQDGLFDVVLRFTEKTNKVAHVPQVLYHRRSDGIDEQSTGPSKRGSRTEIQVVEEALRRRRDEGQARCIAPGRYGITRKISGAPLVSILIPTRNHWKLLSRCIASIEAKTRGARYEVIVLDNDSADPETLSFLKSVSMRWQVLRCPGEFNFSLINNEGARTAQGEYLLFLNNDVEVITEDWLATMVTQAQRPEVGAVGAKLLYPDGSIQHAGVVLGVDGIAGHAFRHVPVNAGTYHGFADVTRNCSAVTAACMLVPREVFRRINGFDEQLRVEFNDVDLCLRIQDQGYRIVYAPDAILYHYENATRKGRRSPCDQALFEQKWGDLIRRGDPHYNPNLTRRREDWGLDV